MPRITFQKTGDDEAIIRYDGEAVGDLYRHEDPITARPVYLVLLVDDARGWKAKSSTGARSIRPSGSGFVVTEPSDGDSDRPWPAPPCQSTSRRFPPFTHRPVGVLPTMSACGAACWSLVLSMHPRRFTRLPSLYA